MMESYREMIKKLQKKILVLRSEMDNKVDTNDFEIQLMKKVNRDEIKKLLDGQSSGGDYKKI